MSDFGNLDWQTRHSNLQVCVRAHHLAPGAICRTKYWRLRVSDRSLKSKAALNIAIAVRDGGEEIGEMNTSELARFERISKQLHLIEIRLWPIAWISLLSYRQ